MKLLRTRHLPGHSVDHDGRIQSQSRALAAVITRNMLLIGMDLHISISQDDQSGSRCVPQHAGATVCVLGNKQDMSAAVLPNNDLECPQSFSKRHGTEVIRRIDKLKGFRTWLPSRRLEHPLRRSARSLVG